MTHFPVLLHVNAISVLDEGADEVLRVAQDEAAATGILFAAHGFNPEVIDRGAVWPGHGGKGSHGTSGGAFFCVDEEFFRGLALAPPRISGQPFEGSDPLREVLSVAKRRGLETHAYILESASTGGRQRDVAGWARVLEIDCHGARGSLPCVNHPAYRAWKLALVENLFKRYDIAGLLWGVERWGPLHQFLVGGKAMCFCSECRSVAVAAGLNWERVRKGFELLHKREIGSRADDGPSGLPLRILLDYPEILAWEAAWTKAYLSIHREIYGVVKWLAPASRFGLGLWHYYFINPLLRAEWDLEEFARSCDYIRPILYHVPEATRIAHYLRALQESTFDRYSVEQLWSVLNVVAGLELPSLAQISKSGVPGSYVAAGVRIAKQASRSAKPILAGIGIDVFQEGLSRQMVPKDVEDGINAAIDAGADGITLSRNFAEMQRVNVAAAGSALRARGVVDQHTGQP